MAKDTTSGSKKVKITNQEVLLKNKSYFKTSVGDEAGCAQKKGIITSKTKGKVYFTSWSMDVKFEGENVVRHLDMTTHNHGSSTNTVPWPYADTIAAFGDPPECAKQTERARKACKNSKLVKVAEGKNKGEPKGVICSKKCKKAMQCILVPKKDDKKKCCRSDTTGHHMIEDHWVKGNSGFPTYRSNRYTKSFTNADQAPKGPDTVSVEDAPTVCVNAKRSKKKHGMMHGIQGVYEESFLPGGKRHVPGHPSGGFTYGEGKKSSLIAHNRTFKRCPAKCIEAQLDNFYQADDDTPLNEPEKQNIGGESNLREPTIKKWGSKVSG